ncbi:hypothetical protein COV88_00160 [Candidatus Saccharibacteria bacterium CG11_big_fil_rev_8_21_14_0_20_41_19]|nr:MAG: hypothetical protein AUK57_03830 [Candidatus Saccharibacteria bacterium CG2_30_41_52]PIQ71196.1 MAG: hypothetical protein COV88_00160 [Candidatus Saccharibacteria bacterium CG11_big_fil_rev_8_21_14_0_20_41_19]
MATKQKLSTKIISIAVLVSILLSQVLPFSTASAAQITARKLTLQAGAADGGSMAGGVVNHLFDFALPSGTTVGSIEFEYCTLAAGVPNPDTCVTPTGLNTTSATIGSQSGAATGFTMVNTTNGAPYLTRTTAVITPGVAQYRLDTITNPTTENETFFVRVSTFASTDATGTKTDTGTVAASTTTQIILSGIMPESLVFCTGATISAPIANVPDCSTATSGAISFNQLFSPVDTAYATSQMAASTNAGSGYNITVNGPTLTSGSNTVVAMNAADISRRGVSQFGLNLVDNTPDLVTPDVGAAISLASNGTNFRAQALAGYNTDATFKFTPGDSVADSASGGAGGTDAQIMTVSYIVNVTGSQPAGTYTSTLTYICTPTF